jgi:hypothetical protein
MGPTQRKLQPYEACMCFRLANLQSNLYHAIETAGNVCLPTSHGLNNSLPLYGHFHNALPCMPCVSF